MKCVSRLGLARGLGDNFGNLSDIGCWDWATVETGETEEKESLSRVEVAALDEDSHHLPSIILGTCGKHIVFLVLVDAVVEFSADVSYRCVEKVILWLGREVLPGN